MQRVVKPATVVSSLALLVAMSVIGPAFRRVVACRAPSTLSAALTQLLRVVAKEAGSP